MRTTALDDDGDDGDAGLLQVAKSTIIAHTVLLGLVLLIDIPVTGIAANLLMVFRGDHFPNSDISSKMRLIMFTSVWTMLFSRTFLFLLLCRVCVIIF